jgi:hypothetical protein
VPKEQYFLRKRKRPMDKEEQMLKTVKAILTLLNSLKDETELALLITKDDLKIPILRTYKEVINDLNYS